MKAVLISLVALAAASQAVAVDLDAAQRICSQHKGIQRIVPIPGEPQNPPYQPEFMAMCTAVDAELSKRSTQSWSEKTQSDLDALKSVAPQQ